MLNIHNQPCLSQFLFYYNANNPVNEKSCFKSKNNPSCIDFFNANSNSFQNTLTMATGLSDFHKMLLQF